MALTFTVQALLGNDPASPGSYDHTFTFHILGADNEYVEMDAYCDVLLQADSWQMAYEAIIDRCFAAILEADAENSLADAKEAIEGQTYEIASDPVW